MEHEQKWQTFTCYGTITSTMYDVNLRHAESDRKIVVAFILWKDNKIDHLITRKDLELQEITKHAPCQWLIVPPLQFCGLIPG